MGSLLASGDVVGNRYVVEALAGSGGMGAVYRARDPGTGGPVAVKVLRALEHSARFHREARILEALSHPAIVSYLGRGELPDGSLYLVTAWIEGEDLACRLRRGPLPVHEASIVGERIAAALAAAHVAGVVHRDVKPSNILLPLGDVRRAMLADFGVARWNAITSQATGTGIVIGTPSYMAPEQARGSSLVDARVDVFALGCVLYECLSGRPPFTGEHAIAVLAKVLLEEAPSLSRVRVGVPPALGRLIQRMLSKDPEGRPSDGAAAGREILDARHAELTGLGALEVRVAAGELRLYSVLMATPAQAETCDGMASTLADPGQDSLLSRLAAVTGGRFEILADGTVLIVLSSAPTARDLATRAARCALDLRSSSVASSIVIATGRGDASQPWPVGEAIDRAVEMLQHATKEPSGTAGIYIDETTAALLDGAFEISGKGSFAELHAEHIAEQGARLLLGKPTPCVGRERELAMLEGTFDACMAEGRCELVLVTAPPGFGKSRLRYELARRLSSREKAPAVWLGRGDEIHTGAPYALVTSLLRSAIGVGPADSAQARHDKLRSAVTLRVSPADVYRIATYLGEMSGMGDPSGPAAEVRAARADATRMNELIEKAWVDFVSEATSRAPLALVLEDLQWSDSSSIALLDALLRDLGERPLFLLGIARPSFRETGNAPFAGRNMSELRLGPLSRKASADLVQRTLGKVDDALVARLVAQADGNALYLEELIRTAAERGAEDLPASIMAMIQARIEAQEPEARRVLRVASIFGGTFIRAGVLAVLGDGPSLQEHWQLLLNRELLSRRSMGTTTEEDVYVFRHALVRDAAYRMIPERDLADLHARASAWFEARAESDNIGLTDAAEHAERAAKACLGLGERLTAATMLARAARLWLAAHRVEPATLAILQALRCAESARPHTGELLEWLTVLASAVAASRMDPGIRGATAWAIQWFDTEGSVEERVSARIAIARALGGANDFHLAFELLDEAIPMAKDAPGTLRNCLVVEAEIAMRSGTFTRGSRAIERLEGLGPLADPRELAMAAMLLGVAGDLAAGERALARALELCPNDDPVFRAGHAKNRSLVYLYAGDVARGAELSLEAADAALAAGLTSDVAANYHNRAESLRRLGDLAGAREALETSLEIARRCGFTRLVHANQIHLTYLDGISGAPDRVPVMESLLADAAQRKYVTDLLEGTALLGLLLLHEGDTVRAREVLERAAELAALHGNRLVEADARAALAGLGEAAHGRRREGGEGEG